MAAVKEERGRIMVSRNLNTSATRTLMEEKGWSQRTFAEKMGVGVAQINRWLNGEAQPRSNKLVRMARMLKVDREALLMPEGK